MRDHCRYNPATGELTCERCGARQSMPLPSSAGTVIAVMGVFLKEHKRCKAPGSNAVAGSNVSDENDSKRG